MNMYIVTELTNELNVDFVELEKLTMDCLLSIRH